MDLGQEAGKAMDGFLVICLCAQWCGTCRDYRVGFDELAATFPDVRFSWLDIEEQADELGAKAEPDDEKGRNGQFGHDQGDAADNPRPPLKMHVFLLAGQYFGFAAVGQGGLCLVRMPGQGWRI